MDLSIGLRHRVYDQSRSEKNFTAPGGTGVFYPMAIFKIKKKLCFMVYS